MHMADALISPAVGGVMGVAAATAVAYSIKKLKKEDLIESNKIPLMGVVGAFVFTAQMINFTIPATGSSGHLSGGLLLAALLGPYAGLLVISAVLAIQALFFADGGLIALGCNIFNIGFIQCFLAYCLVFKPIAAKNYNKKNILIASIISGVLGLLVGAFCVVLQTSISGITELSFGTFAVLMLSIHIPIGIVEGLVTAAVLIFVHTAAPVPASEAVSVPKAGRKVILSALIAVAVLSISVWFASQNPDGLEWSLFKTAGEINEEVATSSHETAEAVQETMSFMPDYNFKDAPESENIINLGATLAAIAGSLLVLIFVGAGVFLIRLFKKNQTT